MKYLKYLSDRFKSLRIMMNMAKEDIPPCNQLTSNPLLGQLRSNDGVIR